MSYHINKSTILLFAIALATAVLISCSDEFFGSLPKPVKCEVSTIEKNIVGTWHFESTFNDSSKVTHGIITFTSQGSILDPDSLFENYLGSVEPVIFKTYKPVVPSKVTYYTGSVFEVYLNIKGGKMQTDFFVVVVNECNKIVLGLIGSQNYHTRFTLTR